MDKQIDTICAIATPQGVGGVAMVRLSGPCAREWALRLMPQVQALPPRRATYAALRLPGEGQALLDEAVVVYYAAPHSYTGEEVVEFFCHGSVYIQQTLLQALLQMGARLAEPGEFTRRAFLTGRMNLSQAEAVADLIDATNATAHRLATSQLRGGYSRQLAALRGQLVEVASLLELELDFGEEEVEFADRGRLQQLVQELARTVQGLCGSFRMGNVLKRGVPVAIVGRPNVGKSTLLNALLQEDRAIVSPVPGTTRDTVEDTLVVRQVQFRFVDTAGLHATADTIEQQGIARSLRAAREAYIILYVTDVSTPEATLREDMAELSREVPLQDKHLLVLRNKVDTLPPDALPTEAEGGELPVLYLSAQEGRGLEAVKDRLVQWAQGEQGLDTLVTNARHYEALLRVQEALAQVQSGLAQRLPADLVLIDLREALYYLGHITGEVTSDEILQNIFSRFCIGK